MVKMAKYLGKSLCAYIRQGDYAHAGETDAIDMVMAPFSKSDDRLILDVGCGLGGTASYIQKNNWGKVVGFDIEQESIDYAKKEYPEVDFYVADVLEVHKVITDIKFDVICLFNVLYNIPDQLSVLSALSKVARPKSQLVIFDYADFCREGEVNPMFNNKHYLVDVHIPLVPARIESMLLDGGWKLTKVIDISDSYTRWYKNIVDAIKCEKEKILKIYGKEYFTRAVATYQSIYQTLIDKQSGGVIVYAEII